MSPSVHSMTGFGRGDADFDGGSVSAEVRSVNSRHLDLRVRLPRDLLSLEGAVKEAVAGRFGRGAIEVSLRVAHDAAAASQVEIDLAAARRYAEAAQQLEGDLGLAGGLGIEALLGLPGVARLREAELDPVVAGPAILEAVGRACEGVLAMRRREGAALAQELRERVASIVGRVTEVEARAEEVRQGALERLRKRLAALGPDVEVEPGRLEQEVVIWIDRMDITEETVRLRSHCQQLSDTLDKAGDPIGRKLEFLLQEMGREANTIGSKGSDADLARHVVELKSDLERLREQVLNLE